MYDETKFIAYESIRFILRSSGLLFLTDRWDQLWHWRRRCSLESWWLQWGACHRHRSSWSVFDISHVRTRKQTAFNPHDLAAQPWRNYPLNSHICCYLSTLWIFPPQIGTSSILVLALGLVPLNGCLISTVEVDSLAVSSKPGLTRSIIIGKEAVETREEVVRTQRQSDIYIYVVAMAARISYWQESPLTDLCRQWESRWKECFWPD